jgi:hypothetical protein
VQEGDVLWTPDPDRIAAANITAFNRWLARHRGLDFPDYASMWRWSVTDLEGFWGALWDYFQIESTTPYTRVLERRSMPGAQWFEGARINYAQHVLRGERAGGTALLRMSELQPLGTMDSATLAAQVRILATRLKALGVEPGDRVVAWMPNIPETMIAMLATTAIGATWACCSPDFGARGALDRLAQLSPKVLFCVDGYRYGGKDFDRREELKHIVGAMDSVQHLIYLPYLDRSGSGPTASALSWHEVLAHPQVPAAEFRFEQVPFDHPLWILFSSGTTGLPKPIVHGHGGILLETCKNAAFHFDLHAGDRLLFFTTTGWMLWNFRRRLDSRRCRPRAVRRPSGASGARRTVEAGRGCRGHDVRRQPELRGSAGARRRRAARALRSVEAAQHQPRRIAGDAGMHGVVLPQREERSLGGQRQRRHGLLHGLRRRRADVAGPCGRDSGAIARRLRESFQRARRGRRERGGRAGHHRADAVHAPAVLG